MPGRRQAAVAARLTRLDVVGPRTGIAAWSRQVAVGAAAILLVVLARTVLDRVAPGVGPFTPTYPILLLATLVGRGPAGLLACAGSFAYIVLFTLGGERGAPLAGETLALTIISLFSCLLVVLLTEGARVQSAALLAERETRIAERDMLLEEVDHRLKNNLAMLAGLLSLQVRETVNDEAREIITRAAARLQSLSKVYENLRYEPGTVTVLDASVLIENLCASLRDALALDGSVTLEAETGQVLITRDRASALALLINEVVTNAAKHAFSDTGHGRIRVQLARRGEAGARVEIADNGRGIDAGGGDASHGNHGGRGRRLLDALAEMAGGDLRVETGAGGTRYILDLKRLP